MNHMKFVDPDKIGVVAREDPDSIILAEFDPPLETAGVQELVAAISTTPIRPDAVAVRVIEYKPDVHDSTALSLDRLSAHTDGSFLAEPPPWFLLSCRRADAGGGANTFIPVDDVVAAAPLWALEALTGAEFRFLKTYDGDLTESFVGPVLTRRSGDAAWLMRWRADHLYRPEPMRDNGSRAADATKWLHEYVEAADPIVHALSDGHLALIPNGRYLHGRTALTPGSRRCVLRAWVY